jgi:hypothetical protein
MRVNFVRTCGNRPAGPIAATRIGCRLQADFPPHSRCPGSNYAPPNKRRSVARGGWLPVPVGPTRISLAQGPWGRVRHGFIQEVTLAIRVPQRLFEAEPLFSIEQSSTRGARRSIRHRRQLYSIVPIETLTSLRLKLSDWTNGTLPRQDPGSVTISVHGRVRRGFSFPTKVILCSASVSFFPPPLPSCF